VKVRAWIAVLAAIIVAVIAAGWSTDWAWLPPLGRWLDGFAKSPGFGALAALAAAAVAYRAATRRMAHDRAVEDDHRADASAAGVQQRTDALEAANQQRWWEMLRWVYDNIDTKDPDKMLRICQTLGGEAHTDGQKAMLAAIVEERLQDDGTED
jgi:hypothetical protein